jgi:hypothetical protein
MYKRIDARRTKVFCPTCKIFIGFIHTDSMGRKTGPQFELERATFGCRGCEKMIAELDKYLPKERPTSLGNSARWTADTDPDAYGIARD